MPEMRSPNTSTAASLWSTERVCLSDHTSDLSLQSLSQGAGINNGLKNRLMQTENMFLALYLIKHFSLQELWQCRSEDRLHSGIHPITSYLHTSSLSQGSPLPPKNRGQQLAFQCLHLSKMKEADRQSWSSNTNWPCHPYAAETQTSWADRRRCCTSPSGAAYHCWHPGSQQHFQWHPDPRAWTAPGLAQQTRMSWELCWG